MNTTVNKVALVTGGSRGLGKDMALQLAKKGFDVVITYQSQSKSAVSVQCLSHPGFGLSITLFREDLSKKIRPKELLYDIIITKIFLYDNKFYN